MSDPTRFYFFYRHPSGGDPGGITVSKQSAMPDGDFRITEYTWPSPGFNTGSLWFVDADQFTADEREAAWQSR